MQLDAHSVILRVTVYATYNGLVGPVPRRAAHGRERRTARVPGAPQRPVDGVRTIGLIQTGRTEATQSLYLLSMVYGRLTFSKMVFRRSASATYDRLLGFNDDRVCDEVTDTLVVAGE